MPEEINLLDYLNVLKKRFKSILIILGFFLLAGIVYIAISPRIYRAVSVILPQGGGETGGSAVLLAQIAGVAGVSGGAAATDPAKKFQLILKSRNFNEKAAIKLMKHLPSHMTIETASGLLMSSLKVIPDIDNLSMSINVYSKDPKLAVTMNKILLEELQDYINDTSMTEAKRRRVYTGEQLTYNRRELLESGKELSDYYKKNNISPVSPVVDVNLALPEMWPNNSLGQLEEQVNVLEQEKKKSEVVLKNQHVKEVPQQIYLEYLSQKRIILSTLNGLLSQQYEMAKMEEARESISFMIIDEAREPTSAYKPQTRLIMTFAFIGGLLCSVLFVFMVEYFQSLRARRKNVAIN